MKYKRSNLRGGPGVPGAVTPQVGGVRIETAIIPVSGIQAAIVQNGINQSIQNPPNYDIGGGQYTCDCASWIQQVLGSAGINAGAPTQFPGALVNQLNAYTPRFGEKAPKAIYYEAFRTMVCDLGWRGCIDSRGALHIGHRARATRPPSYQPLCPVHPCSRHDSWASGADFDRKHFVASRNRSWYEFRFIWVSGASSLRGMVLVSAQHHNSH
jgi:hypothetical protein